MVSVSTSNVIDFEDLVSPESTAVVISQKWRDYNNFRQKWIEEKRELRNYLFATDTRTTGNASLPWANSTTTPKLTQIRDNLHANYMATMFPNSDWLIWKAMNEDARKEKRKFITNYVRTKTNQSDFLKTAAKLTADFIDYGNCFAMVDHINENVVKDDGEIIPGYVGPKLVRISPFDIAFNPTADTFEQSPKIIKRIVGLGDIAKAIKDNPVENEALSIVFNKMISVRNIIRTTDAEIHKSDGYVADGFSNITMYYDSEYVELLTFYGNMYNKDTGELISDRVITIADRSFVVSDEAQPSWLGVPPIRHVGWRDRPDNLYAMGPLDNLVGLQYRIDHLENMKADVWDMISNPTKIIRGDVEEMSGVPGETIYVGDEGDVSYLFPDATALNADQQIDRIMFHMEEMAGAPRQAMGIRTPGEKTAFEVDTLQNAGNRIFRHKTGHMEANFFEPLLNDFLEVGRRNLDKLETIEFKDEDNGTVVFEDITREDITARGKIFPMGARHFAERNTRVQNLNQVWQMKVSDPSVGVHISGKKIAELIADELSEPTIFGENIGITEQAETQSMMADAEVDFEEQQEEAAELGL